MKSKTPQGNKPDDSSAGKASPTDSDDAALQCPKCDRSINPQKYAEHIDNCTAPDITDFGGSP